MKLSIRTNLTLLIALVYFSVFLFLIAGGAVALYFGLNEEADKALQAESERVIDLFQSEYADLIDATGATRTRLREEFLEELTEMYGYQGEFAILSLESDGTRRILAGGGLKNAQLLLPKGFLSKEDGAYNQRLGTKIYRVLINHMDWGTVVIGKENQTFFEVADEFKELVAVGLPLTLLLVLLMGRFLAGRAMRPVVAAAESAEKISLTRLDERLPHYTGRDEFGKLVATLNGMIARLEEGVKRVRRFTQDAAHELRTPLTLVRGELELAYQHEALPDDLRDALQKALDHAISMTKMVDNLMLLARSDTGSYPIESAPFQLDEVVREIVDDLKALVNGRRVRVRLLHCDPVRFTGDRQLIHRLLLNLCDNALRHTSKGHIDLSLQADGEQVELTVSDTGTGIPPEDLPHIFERFYRVDKSRTSTTGGSGLGLAISKWIVEAHGGEINIASELSRGTTVKIILPYRHSS